MVKSLLSLCVLWLGSALVGRAGDPNTQTPTATHAVPFRLGQVEAVSGALQMRIPMGPRLPGRIPLGFTWAYNNQDEDQGGIGGGMGGGLGGSFRPAVWPSAASLTNRFQISVMVDGKAQTFFRQAQPAGPLLLSKVDAKSRLQALGATIFDRPAGISTGATLTPAIYPSSDGTKFLYCAYWSVNVSTFNKLTGEPSTTSTAKIVATSGMAILDGPSTIWTKLDGVTHFMNAYGDHVTATETLRTDHYIGKIVIADVNVPRATVTLTTGGGINYTWGQWQEFRGMAATVNIDNTLIGDGGAKAPQVVVYGYLTAHERPVNVSLWFGDYCDKQPTVDGITPVWPGAVNHHSGIWDGGYIPTSVVSTAGSESITTTITWKTCPEALGNSPVPAVPNWPSGLVKSIAYPNDVVETFTYDSTTKMSALSYHPETGLYVCFRDNLCFHPAPAATGPNSDGTSEPYFEQTLENYWSWGVCLITTTGVGAGQAETVVGAGNATLIARNTYQENMNGLIQTSILHYGTATPSTSEPFRGERLYHPTSASAMNGYLYGTQAILRAEKIVGTGAPMALSNGSGAPSLQRPTKWVPPAASTQVIQTMDFDGWDLRSWANPTGALTASVPLNAIPLRTTVYTPDLPTKVTLAGAASVTRDDYGPIQTDEYTLLPSLPPALDAAAVPVLGSGVIAPVDFRTHRTGKITRAWDPATLTLQMKTDQKQLDGPEVSQIRFDSAALPSLVGVSSVDFGTTATTYDPTTGFPASVTGSRGSGVATEARIYGVTSVSGKPLPLVTRSEKSLTVNGSAVPANPADSTVKVGRAYTYDTTPYRWLLTESDLTDGRVTTYTRDALGRETLRVDPLGITLRTTYDAWGRVATVTRDAKGSVGAVVTAYTYDPNGLWKSESVTAEGRTLTTRTDLDGYGRVKRVTLPDGSIQTTIYSPFGEKALESPVLKPGQSAWGYAAWRYDTQGRLTDSSDTQGRPTSHVTQQAKYQSQVVEGVLVRGIWTTSTDAKGYSRSEVRDLLGQKVAIVDQKGQLSRFFYDADGHLLQTNQGGQIRWYRYNDLGWLTERFEPEEGSTRFTNQNLVGAALVTSQQGRSGSGNWTTSTSLDSHLRPIQVTAAGPEGSVTRIFTYDDGQVPSPRNSRLLYRVQETQNLLLTGNQTLTETYTTDDLYRVNAKTVSDGLQTFTLSRTLDASGNVLTESLPAMGGRTAQVISHTVDSLNRPKQVLLGSASRGLMTYDQSITETAVTNLLTYGNGVTTRSKVDRGELVLTEHAVVNDGGILKNAAGAPTLLESNALAWDARGLLMARGGDVYDYDELQRLTYATTGGINAPAESITQTFSYDRYGNRASEGFSYSGPAKPKEVLAYTATYGMGNDLPATISTPGGDVPTFRVYDDLGRLTQVNAVPGALDEMTSWAYDPSGRVMKETINGVTSTFLLDGGGLRFKRVTGTTTTYTLYGFGREPLMVFDQVGGTLTWKKTLVHGFGQLLSEEKPTGTTYIQSDYVGSPNLITDAAGTVVGRTKNLPFGERHGQLGTEKSTRRFTNHEDQPGSTIYMQARTYLPVYGKFAQVDPAYDQTKDDPETWNLYGYCANNPVTHTDPDGRVFQNKADDARAAAAWARSADVFANGSYSWSSSPPLETVTVVVQTGSTIEMYQVSSEVAAAAMSEAGVGFNEWISLNTGTGLSQSAGAAQMGSSFMYYNQDTGAAYINKWTPNKDGSWEFTSIDLGDKNYSGRGDGKNNSSMEDEKGNPKTPNPNAGPIPAGSYSVSGPEKKPGMADPVLRLTPDGGQDMHGRNGFLIHGDSTSHPGEASQGCIVMPRAMRQAIVDNKVTNVMVFSNSVSLNPTVISGPDPRGQMTLERFHSLTYGD